MIGDSPTIWTIGHSNHSRERLIELLRAHGISAVADVRTSPYSRYSSQFNKEQLQRALESQGIRYLFLGAELGGRPADSAMYDADGRVSYDRVAASEPYRVAIGRLLRGAADHRIALLCGEEDPISCHRRRLVGRTLGEHGVAVLHIRGDRSTSSEEAIVTREATEFPERFQLTLAGPPPWRSEHPVVGSDRSGGDEWTES